MGNCCVITKDPTSEAGQFVSPKRKNNKANPFAPKKDGGSRGGGGRTKFLVLKDPTGKTNIHAQYELGRELGRGEFGITHLCTDRVSSEVFACKSISKKKLRTSVDIDDVKREVEIMKHLPNHPNVVTLKDVYEDDKDVHIIMELCGGGELFDRIVARGHYTERAAASITKTIVEVVQMCHKEGVMHRDLKPENFLFANKKESSPIKAIDFGLSVFFTPGETFNEIVGSPFYMAPEVLKRSYGPEVDVWSAGVIVYILLCGVPPFWADTEKGVAQAIIRSHVDFKRDPWPIISDSAKDLVKRMLDPDRNRRLTAQQVLDHPWLQNAKKAPNISLGENVRTRLRQFSVMNRLKKRALRVVAEQLSAEEEAGFKEMFESMNTSKTGKLTAEELKIGLHNNGHKFSEADIQISMDAAEKPGKGYLEYREFLAISLHLRKMYSDDEHLHKAFSFFDKNKSGFIEVEELRDCLSDDLGSDPEDVIASIIQDVDTDKDGRISYEEFVTMMKAGTDWRMSSRQYSREKFSNLSVKLMTDGSLKMLSIASGRCWARQCFFSTSRHPRLSLQIRNSAGGSEEKDESTQFEIDPETAREALKKLDQQFQSLSQKTQPSVKSEEEKNKNKNKSKNNPLLTSFDSSYIDSDVGMRRKIGREQDMPELSGSFLGYSAVILLAITFLTNILFIVFVKPAFDG